MLLLSLSTQSHQHVLEEPITKEPEPGAQPLDVFGNNVTHKKKKADYKPVIPWWAQDCLCSDVL